MRSAEKANLNILKIKKEEITHQQNPQEISIEESPSSEAADLKPATSLKINPQRGIPHIACWNVKMTAST